MSRIAAIAVLLAWVVACSDQTDVTEPERSAAPKATDATTSTAELNFKDHDFRDRDLKAAHTALSGGATTVFDYPPGEAFSQPAPNLQGANVLHHEAGDVAFELEFEDTSGLPNSGLGPVFDNVSCEECHLGDGRGRPPDDGVAFESLLFRASIAGRGPNGGPNPVPGFGTQLQLRSVGSITPEARATLQYVARSGSFADGTPFQLYEPQYTLTGGYEPLPQGVLFSPRVAPAVFGLGLLEAVPPGEILSRADPRDRNRDGVSGRPNIVFDAVSRRYALGRFGWKANVANLVQQTAGAYNGDMGITSPLFPAESCEGQYGECAAHGNEVTAETVQDVALYTRTLGVPARRNLDDALATRGERLFYRSGCASCHAPTLRTVSLPGVPEVSNQVIHPYTDLLLHDMGPALADSRPDFLASGSEWRTPPLWGIGLVESVNGHTHFMHDGRARSLLEAVLWHGGEAKAARDRVLQMRADEREALVAFLRSL